ncbi:hypothetical protein [Nesterenkonia aerolata]|uniref:Uncharacterized protein n=1 Tax=Nesterenkonia aerolata TaxID=3074079 RepID=A0ABU2DSD9_9MICC|nr:hypothetical protein [Nesterenkonia sp. LY-0111]MDR8019394.1 hypothetical protein [Nesterenkonia sp. LY-0111]
MSLCGGLIRRAVHLSLPRVIAAAARRYPELGPPQRAQKCYDLVTGVIAWTAPMPRTARVALGAGGIIGLLNPGQRHAQEPEDILAVVTTALAEEVIWRDHPILGMLTVPGFAGLHDAPGGPVYRYHLISGLLCALGRLDGLESAVIVHSVHNLVVSHLMPSGRRSQRSGEDSLPVSQAW